MKLLLRQFGDECYVWKNAEMNDEKTFIVDGRTVNQGNVVSIYGDNRNKFVKCSHCGTILKNTDAEIKEHRLMSTTSTICFRCPNLRKCEEITKSIKYVLQDDGKYIATVKKISWVTAVCFVIGALFSTIAGYCGMTVATKANVRTANAARTSGMNKALSIAFSGGAVMGLLLNDL